MGMLGNQLAAGQALTVANDSFNGDGSTTAFTLSQTVGSVNDIEVLVDNVQQSPYDSSYSVSGTTLTFSGAPATGTNNIYVIYNASKHITTQQVIPDDGSVTHSKFHTNALNPITLDPINNRLGIGTSTPLSTVHQDVGLTSRDGYKLFYGTDPKAAFTVHPNSGEIRIGAATVGTSGNYYTEIMSRNGSNLVTSIKADNYGRVTMPNQPAFGMTTSVNGGMVAANTDIILNAGYNGGNHVNTSTGIFTAPVSGRYYFSAFSIKNNANGTVARLQIRKNGSTVAEARMDESGNYCQAHCSILIDLAANDQINFRNNDSTIFYMGGTYGRCNGYLVG